MNSEAALEVGSAGCCECVEGGGTRDGERAANGCVAECGVASYIESACDGLIAREC